MKQISTFPITALLVSFSILTQSSLAGLDLTRRQFVVSACTSALLTAIPNAAKKASTAGKVRWEIVGQQSKNPNFQGTLDIDLRKSLGEITLEIFAKYQIPYLGNESAINSILGTPTGDEAIVVVNDKTLKAYGWCYEVDGRQPDVMPDKFYFEKEVSVLRWFYAFSLYEDGVWKSYCTPA